MINETDKTKLARESLAKYTDKPIILTSLQEISEASGMKGVEGYLGVCKKNDDHIIVALNPNKFQTHESSW
jgi:hypothetical protein